MYINIDVDECAVNNGSCSNSCVNTMGGHECQCPEGLELSWDKRTCIGELDNFILFNRIRMFVFYIRKYCFNRNLDSFFATKMVGKLRFRIYYT